MICFHEAIDNHILKGKFCKPFLDNIRGYYSVALNFIFALFYALIVQGFTKNTNWHGYRWNSEAYLIRYCFYCVCDIINDLFSLTREILSGAHTSTLTYSLWLIGWFVFICLTASVGISLHIIFIFILLLSFLTSTYEASKLVSKAVHFRVSLLCTFSPWNMRSVDHIIWLTIDQFSCLFLLLFLILFFVILVITCLTQEVGVHPINFILNHHLCALFSFKGPCKLLKDFINYQYCIFFLIIRSLLIYNKINHQSKLFIQLRQRYLLEHEMNHAFYEFYLLVLIC